MYHFLFSLISLIIAIFFVSIGIVSILIPWSENVRTALIGFINEDALAISLFGFTFIVIALGMIANIFINSRKKYYYVKSGNYDVAVDETVIQQYLTRYWKELFPDSEVASRLTLKNNQIHVSVDFPYQPTEAQKLILDRVKDDLQRQFASNLGYEREFFLAASFQSSPKS